MKLVDIATILLLEEEGNDLPKDRQVPPVIDMDKEPSATKPPQPKPRAKGGSGRADGTP